VLTNNIILLFSLLVASVLMGVVRMYLIHFFVGILIIVLWLRGCPVCEVLLCVLRGTGSGMLSRVLLVVSFVSSSCWSVVI
jgi:hypothetical protein